MKPEEKKPQPDKKGLKDQAINKKANASDGREINHQVKQKQEKHQPRDTA